MPRRRVSSAAPGRSAGLNGNGTPHHALSQGSADAVPMDADADPLIQAERSQAALEASLPSPSHR